MEDLPIWARLKIRILGGMFRINPRTIVDDRGIYRGIHIRICKLQVGVNVQQFTERMDNVKVELEKCFPSPFEEKGLYVVCIELKERTVSVGRAKCIPMQMAPVAVVTDKK